MKDKVLRLLNDNDKIENNLILDIVKAREKLDVDFNSSNLNVLLIARIALKTHIGFECSALKSLSPKLRDHEDNQAFCKKQNGGARY